MIKNEPDVNNYIKMPEWWELTEQHSIPSLNRIAFKNPPDTMELTAFNEAYKVPNTNCGAEIEYRIPIPDEDKEDGGSYT